MLSSSGLQFWSVNRTSMDEDPELSIFKKINFQEKYLVIDPTIY